jgi:protein-disulfide isomerase
VAALAAAVVAAIVLIGVANLFSGDDNTDNITPVDIPDPIAVTRGMELGEAGAPVIIYEYSDFQCPFCARAAAEIVPPLDETYLTTGKAKLVYKNLAFLGDESRWAAQAAACASEQGKFWQYHNKLFENQKGENKGAFKVENLKRFAAEIGLNQGDFNTCFDEERYASKIADDVAEAERRDIKSTPTFFVGQTPVESDYDSISAAIEEALATPGATATPAEGTPTAEGTPGG